MLPQAAGVFAIVGLIAFFATTGGLRISSLEWEMQRRRQAVLDAEDAVSRKHAELMKSEESWRKRIDQERNQSLASLRALSNRLVSDWSGQHQALLTAAGTISSDSRDLPLQYQRLLNERRRSAQREDFLRSYRISQNKIPHIGPARSVTLSQYGIETAWDVIHMGYVPRLGQGEYNLRGWVSDLERRFVFNPDGPVSRLTQQEIRRDVAKLEDQLREKFGSLAQSWMQFQRDFAPARLQEAIDRHYETLKRGLALTIDSAANHNRSLLTELEDSLRALGQATADASVLPE